MCRGSMYPAEISSSAEREEQMRTQFFGPMFLGGQRINATHHKWLTSNTDLTYVSWRPLRPTTTLTDDCIKKVDQMLAAKEADVMKI